MAERGFGAEPPRRSFAHALLLDQPHPLRPRLLGNVHAPHLRHVVRANKMRFFERSHSVTWSPAENGTLRRRRPKGSSAVDDDARAGEDDIGSSRVGRGWSGFLEHEEWPGRGLGPEGRVRIIGSDKRFARHDCSGDEQGAWSGREARVDQPEVGEGETLHQYVNADWAFRCEHDGPFERARHGRTLGRESVQAGEGAEAVSRSERVELGVACRRCEYARE